MRRKRVFAATGFAAMSWATLSAQNSRSPEAPRAEQLKAAVNDAYSKFKNDTSGKNADYIPYVAQVDSKLFAVALVTTDNNVYTWATLTARFQSSRSRRSSHSR